MDDDKPGHPIAVHGLLGDKLLCLGMLEMAKLIVLQANPGEPRVLPASAVPPGMVKS